MFIPTVPAGATYTIRGTERTGGYQLSALDNREVFGGDASGIRFDSADVTTSGGTVSIATPTFQSQGGAGAGFRYFTGSPGSNGYREYKDWPIAVASGSTYPNRLLYRATSVRYNFEGRDFGSVDSNTNAGFQFIFARRANQPPSGSTTANNIDSSGPPGRIRLTGIRANSISAMVSTERFVVSNPHPFDVFFTATNSTQMRVPADGSITVDISGSTDNTWTITTPTTTQYRYTLTNNNARPIDINAGSTWGTMAIEVPANGGQIISDFGTRGFTAMVIRELLQGAAGSPNPITATMNMQGVGDVTPPAMQRPVTYRFQNTGIGMNGLTIDIPLTADTSDDMNPTNVQVENTIVTTLMANDDFNDYYTIRTHNDDTAIDPGRFDLIARALPGATFRNQDDTADLTFPTTPTLFSSVVDEEFGGRAALTANIGQGVDVADAPIVATVTTGTMAFDPATGAYTTETILETTMITISGSYAAGVIDPTDTMPDPGRNQLNEVFRQAYRSAPLNTRWGISSGNSLDPDAIGITSTAAGNHFSRVTTAPAMVNNIALAPYFQFDTTTEGIPITSAANAIYPTLTITPPSSEASTESPRVIRLRPSHLVPEPTQRMDNTAIAEIIRNNFNLNDDGTTITSDWGVQESLVLPTTVGTGVVGNRIKLFKNTPESVDGVWTFAITSYGNTGTTLPGTTQSDDGMTVGRLNGAMPPGLNDFSRVGMGDDNLYFDGANIVRAQPTRIMLTISNPDSPNGIQYLPYVFGQTADYDVNTQFNAAGNPATNVVRTSASDMINAIESGINNANRRITTSRSGNTLTILPSQYSGLANFVLGVEINDDAAGVTAWNTIIDANPTLAAINVPTLVGPALRISSDNGGIQSYGPTIVRDPADTQASRSTTRRPDRVDRVFSAVPNVITTREDPANPMSDIVRIQTPASPALITDTSVVNTVFDPLRPWPTTQVNLNREYPIFINSLLNDATGQLTQTIRGADIGFLFLRDQYESFIERIELALTPEFDTEQLGSLALWADGGSRVTFGQPIQQATLDVKVYGTDSPGETLGRYTNMPMIRNADNTYVDGTTLQRTTDNQFIIGQDYKIDMRVQGRFINILISDYDVDDTLEGMNTSLRNPNPSNMAMDTNLNVPRGISWNISGMQAEIQKGGRR